MSLLSSVVMGGAPQPPRVVIYGPDGIGKTTFAAAAPQPIVQRTEDGLKTIRVPTFPGVATSYAQVMDNAYEVATGDHPFQTYITDSLTQFEPLVWKATCERCKTASIEDIGGGYGKGYLEADAEWRQFLDVLDIMRDRGIVVVLIGHADIKRFNSPETEPYDRYQLKLQERAAKLVRMWADVVGFAKPEVFTEAAKMAFNKSVVRGVGTGSRVLCTEERPAYHAKNRYQLPPELPLVWSELESRISAAISAPSGVPDWMRVADREESAQLASVAETVRGNGVSGGASIGGSLAPSVGPATLASSPVSTTATADAPSVSTAEEDYPGEAADLRGAAEPGDPIDHSDDCALGIGGECDCPAMVNPATIPAAH